MSKNQSKKNVGPTAASTSEEAPKPRVAPRQGTKQALVCELLSRETGASLEELIAATGWLPHTTRAALTGLRKRGCTLTKEKVEGITRYRLTAGA
jgi:hypothetical protein